jgi:SAM-dependent methyltransferase
VGAVETRPGFVNTERIGLLASRSIWRPRSRRGRCSTLVLAEDVETALGKLDESFDLVVCADVLEHLVDPWETVRRLRSVAAPGGTPVMSVPNIRFYRALWKIGFGDGFRYETDGIFDVTHLRFFTRSTIESMVQDADWTLTRDRFVPGPTWAASAAGAFNRDPREVGGMADVPVVRQRASLTRLIAPGSRRPGSHA